MAAAASEPLSFRLQVRTASEVTRLSVCGNFQGWQLSTAVELKYTEELGNVDGSTMWCSEPLTIAANKLPLRLRFVANGHRSSPNTRPLIWDSSSRVFHRIPPGGLIKCEFEPTPDSSDTGWVTADGVGAYQLRVGQPPGSTEALITLEPQLGHAPEEVDVVLWEAKAHDPAVPQGKVLARVGVGDAPAADAGGAFVGPCTYLLNSQSVEELAFRVDVNSRRTGSLLARCFISPDTLQTLEGNITAALLTPQLQHAGTFRASFLVVASLQHPANNLGNLQRARWVPGGSTLDIGHRGSGASKVQGHAVRENTLLSFNKAAVNHAEYIEFDVHVTADGEVVVFHDFLVPIRLGTEVVRLPIPSLTAAQLRSTDFTQWMVSPNEDAPNKDALDEEKARRRTTLQRNLSSAEDMFRSIFKPQFAGPPPMSPTRTSSSSSGGSNSSSETVETAAPAAVGDTAAGVAAARWFLTDRIASLRETFRRTPKWLGFNIELKYPTALEVASMRSIWWSRNHFVDAVLKVVLEEGAGRRVIFSTFDPDCATLLSLKQPRFPVLFLTCGGTKTFTDPRMNSLEAALQFALASRLQGVVAEVTSVLARLHDVVQEFHCHGLYLYTYGDANNNYASYMAQREAGIDAIILDDTEKMARRTGKRASTLRALFSKNMRSPASTQDMERLSHSGGSTLQVDLERISSGLNMVCISPIGSPAAPMIPLAPPPPSIRAAMGAYSPSPAGHGELPPFFLNGAGPSNSVAVSAGSSMGGLSSCFANGGFGSTDFSGAVPNGISNGADSAAVPRT